MTTQTAEKMRTDIATINNLCVAHSPPSEVRDTIIRALDHMALTIAEEEDGRPYAGKVKTLASQYRMTT